MDSYTTNKITIIFRVLITILLVLPCACNPQKPMKIVKLSSGKEMKLAPSKQVYYGKKLAIVYDFYTTTDFNDKEILRKEIEEIWDILNKKVDYSKVNNVIINANNNPKGLLIKHTKTFTVLIVKSDDGSWNYRKGIHEMK